jgi:hypothetical protein
MIGNCAKAYLSAMPDEWVGYVQQLQWDLPIYSSRLAFHLRISSESGSLGKYLQLPP